MDDSFSHIEINQHPFHTEEKRNYTIDENEKTFTKDGFTNFRKGPRRLGGRT